MTTPEYTSLSEAIAAKEASTKGAAAAENLKQAAKDGKVERMERTDGSRAFLSPTHPNERFLVTAGPMEYANYQSAVLGLKPAVQRVGDVWCTFSSSICETVDPQIIAFLEAHSGSPERHRAYHEAKQEDPRGCGTPIGLCREQGPGIDIWAELKLAQVPLAYRNATMSNEIDVDALMRGEYADRTMTRGAGADMAESLEGNANAAAERADGIK